MYRWSKYNHLLVSQNGGGRALQYVFRLQHGPHDLKLFSFSILTDKTLSVKSNIYLYVIQVITTYHYMKKHLCGILASTIY